jgi:hypothetical protein
MNSEKRKHELRMNGAGKNSAGKNSAGKNGAGKNGADKNSAGKNSEKRRHELRMTSAVTNSESNLDQAGACLTPRRAPPCLPHATPRAPRVRLGRYGSRSRFPTAAGKR